MALPQQTAFYLIPLVCLGILVGAFLWLKEPQEKDHTELPGLSLLADSSLRPAMNEIVALYQRRSGVPVKVTYNSAAELISQLESSETGDVFIPGSPFDLQQATRKGLVRNSTPFATMTPVLQVQRGNPKSIQSLDNLTGEGIRIAIANEYTSSIGRITPTLLQAQGIEPSAIREKATVTGDSADLIAQAVALRQVDVAINWKPVAMLYQLTESVPIPDTQNAPMTIEAALLTTARDPAAANDFIRFLSGSASQDILRRLNYDPAINDTPIVRDNAR